ncbi:MAG: hypothetical protein EBZ32_12510 [Rhodobacteraceae bacterium]|nr:hypothetical protein [Paracoccaceae bacterium]
MIGEHNTLSLRHLPFISLLITITYVKILLLAPHMAPQLAGKIISALACKKGWGQKTQPLQLLVILLSHFF